MRAKPPLLVTLFEAAAAALDLDAGPHALVLGIVDGELAYWSTGGRDDRRPPAELAAADARVAWLVDASDGRARLEAAIVASGRHAGVDLARGHATVTVRLEDGRVRWIEPGRVRVPVSELESPLGR
jgi:hypothetical protein